MTLTENTGSERFFDSLSRRAISGALGISTENGRFFLPEEISAPDSAPYAELSYNAWKIRFDGAPEVIGKILDINGTSFTVVGVAPKGFLGVSAVFGPDVWLPATMAQQALPAPMRDVLRERGKPLFQTVARLKPGIRRDQTEASLQPLAAALRQQYPDANAGHTIAVRPITTALYSTTGGERGLAIVSTVLLVIVGLVLLIACSNVANLLMARAVSRRQEIAVRLAIGASRGRLLRQLLTESVCSSASSAALPDLASATKAAVSSGPSDRCPKWRAISSIPNSMAPCSSSPCSSPSPPGSSSVSCPRCALRRPAWLTASRKKPMLPDFAGRSARFQKTLLTGQVALSLVSLIAASFFLRAVQRAYAIDPGFDDQHLAVLMMNPEQVGYDAVRLKDFRRDVADRVARLPEVAAVSWASNMPFWSSPSRGILIQGQEQDRKSETISTVANTVDLDYFKTMRIPLLQGRAFTDEDQDGSLPVVIVNENLARRYWPNGNAIGQHLRLTGDTIMRQIVGVVKTSNYSTLGEAPQPCLYLPMGQNPGSDAILYVRTARDPRSFSNRRRARSEIPIPKSKSPTSAPAQRLWTRCCGMRAWSWACSASLDSLPWRWPAWDCTASSPTR